MNKTFYHSVGKLANECFSILKKINLAITTGKEKALCVSKFTVGGGVWVEEFNK